MKTIAVSVMAIISENRRVMICVGLTTLFAGCSGNDDYRDTLDSGLKKYYSGDSMTKKEHDAVKNFNNWKSKQGEKKYSDWD